MHRFVRLVSALTALALACCAVATDPATPDPVREPPPELAAPDAAPASSSSGHGGADASSDASGDAAASAPLQDVHFLGRFDHSDPAGARFQWSGSTLVASFQGTGIGMRLRGKSNHFAVRVDGGEAVHVVFDGTSETVPLAAGLAAGVHRIEVSRRTEASFGIVQFLGFSVQEGALVPSPFPYAHRIEIIGDSMSCGFGNEGDGPSCPFSAATENEDAAYGAVTARALGAAHTTIAWSGKGMFRNNCCGASISVDTLPLLYDRTLPGQPDSIWDPAGWPAEAVVVNLGTNDFATGDPGLPYEAAYATFLERLRAIYPSAELFCVMGAMENRNVAHERVQAVVQARHAAGDARVHYVRFGHQNIPAHGIGCQSHPSVATHAVMAEVLTAAIREVTGW